MSSTSAILAPPAFRPETAPVTWRGGPPLHSSRLSSTSSAAWPVSYTLPQQSSSAALAVWPAIPDSFARWPAKGPPTATLTSFPKRFTFRVELADGESKCVVCSEKLKKGGPQVMMRKCEGFRLMGYRCVTCVKPHTLRVAGGGSMVEMDQVRAMPPRSPLCTCSPASHPPCPTHRALAPPSRPAASPRRPLACAHAVKRLHHSQALPQRVRMQVQMAFYNTERKDCYRH